MKGNAETNFGSACSKKRWCCLARGKPHCTKAIQSKSKSAPDAVKSDALKAADGARGKLRSSGALLLGTLYLYLTAATLRAGEGGGEGGRCVWWGLF